MGLPVEVNNLMLGSLGGYTVGRSLRFRSSASAYLNRTPSVARSAGIFTFSTWVKRGALSSQMSIFSAWSFSDVNYQCQIRFTSGDNLEFYNKWGTDIQNYITTQVFRDPSAWYHFVIAVDLTQSVGTNAIKLYVNGVQITSFSTSSFTNSFQGTAVNNNTPQSISSNVATSASYFDGYQAEVNMIGDAQLTPSSFGAYDTNGVWQPKKYTGTYGTNGFYLPFSNTTSTTTLVQDSSGNGNNWTPNNISLTAGTTYDSMIDSPTVSASSSNYATLNPLFNTNSLITYSAANLEFSVASPNNKVAHSTMQLPLSGKWYFEAAYSSGTQPFSGIGVSDGSFAQSSGTGFTGGVYRFYQRSGNKSSEVSSVAYGATYTNGDIIGVAVNMDAGTIEFYKNNVSQGVAYTNLAGINWYAAIYSSESAAWINFGQRPFTYTPPTGFKALNTYNLPAPSIANGAQYMNTVLWSGNSTANRNITGVGFNPDFVWLKCRNSTQHHHFVDVVRGTGTSVMRTLFSSSTNAEDTDRSGTYTRYGNINALITDGFTVNSGTDPTYPYDQVNATGLTYTAWNWKAGGTGVTNNSGTITSTVSANTTAGFSVVTYTGNGTQPSTVGHGLGVAPSFIITKRRNTGATDWNCWFTGFANNDYIVLNSTVAKSSDPNTFPSAAGMTSSVFTIGNGAWINGSGNTYVAYCFAAVRGYSAFGSYTGNGSTDGPFVYTGFRPRWVLIKSSSATGDWTLIDTSRSSYNQANDKLFPDLFAAESSTAYDDLDILSNGFKVRGLTVSSNNNANGVTYIYAAFAENPFNYSRAR